MMRLASDNESTPAWSPVRVTGDDRDIRFETIDVTPEIAEEMLKRVSDDSRRAPRQRVIEEYRQTMEKGLWLENGMPIIFDEKGELIDGVQRLHAVIKAGVPFRTNVAYNVRSDTLHTIDQHRRRTFPGVLESRGIDNAGAVIRLMTNLIRIENGDLGIENYPIGWGRYDKVLAANPDIVDSARLAVGPGMRGTLIEGLARSTLIYMARAAGYGEQVMEFLSVLKEPKEGEEETLPLDSPALQLRNLLIMHRSTATQRRSSDFSEIEQLSLAILAFNDYVQGIPRTRPYRWMKTPVDKDKKSLQRKDERSTEEAGSAPLDVWNRKSLRKYAPDNLGMPKMIDYPPLKQGMIDQKGKEIFRLSPEMEARLEEGSRKTSLDRRTMMVEVTPEMAQQWLDRFNVSNRKIQPGHIRMIARDIEQGRWMINAQPICFTADPMSYDYSDDPVRKEGDMRLLNGQHRLMACVEADIPIEVPIATHIAEEAFVTYDIQSKKGHSGMIGKDGLKVDARIAAAAARLQWREDHGYDPAARKAPTPSESEIQETLEIHSEITDGAIESRDPELLKIASGGILLYLVYRIRRERPDLADEFIQFLRTGSYGESHPMIPIRSSLYGKRREMHRLDVLAELLKAWDLHKEFIEAGKRKSAEPAQADLL